MIDPMPAGPTATQKFATKQQISDIVTRAAKTDSTMTAARVIAAFKRKGYVIEGDPTPSDPPIPPTLGRAPADTTQVASAAAPADTIQAAALPQAPPTNYGRMAVNAIPAAAGLVGGVVGGLPGAAIGGLGGELLREGLAATGKQFGMDLGNVPKNKNEIAQQVGTSGVEQLGAELGGRVIGGALKFAARGPMAAALRRIKVGDTNLAKVAFDEGIGVSQRGLDKLNKKISEWTAQRAAHLDAAGLSGLRYQPADLVKQAADKVINDLKGRVGIKSEAIGAVEKWRDNFIADNPNIVSPAKLLDMRQIADDEAKAVYENVKMAAKGRAPAVPQLDKAVAQANKELADIARKHLSNIGQKVTKTAKGGLITPIEHATNQLEKLTHLKQVLQPMVDRAMPLAGRAVGPAAGVGVGGAIGGALGGARTHSPAGVAAGAAAGATLAHPAVLSHLALLAAHPALANFILPNLLRASYFGGEQANE